MLPESRRFLAALSAYATLALLAALTLTGLFRIVVWVCLAGFAVKTWIAMLRQQ